jgi:acetyl-CoA carboxylase carboxyl transferase subunit beta
MRRQGGFVSTCKDDQWIRRGESVNCPKCHGEISAAVLEVNLRVCPQCNWHFGLTARQRVAQIADAGTFKEIDAWLCAADPLRFDVGGAYRDRVREAQRRTGMQEAALIGEALLDGHRIVLVCVDFEFMGGTMGSVVGEKIARAFDRATLKELPVVSVLASGGARLQEGMFALMQMAKTAAAEAHHRAKGLPFISVLTNPSFGGPVASFASLGDFLIAEPGAQIGFAGARVVEGTIAEKIPATARSAESLIEHGLIDMVVHRQRLKNVLSSITSLAVPGSNRKLPKARRAAPVRSVLPAAQVVALARHSQRPRARDYIQCLFSVFIELHGDRCYADDRAVIGGLAAFHGIPVIVIAQHGIEMPRPEGYRKAHRLLRLAGKLRLPVITLIDTPGAHPGLDAEYRGLTAVLSESFAILTSLDVPIVSVVIGEGGSGGALALGIGDVMLMQENAIYSVISPEGAAAILYGDSGRSSELLSALKLRASDLLELEIIDDVVGEPAGGAHLNPEAAAAALDDKLLYHLNQIVETKPDKLVASRLKRFRSVGKFEKGWMQMIRAAIDRMRPTQVSTSAPRHESAR